jgi:hypothetical protein
MKQGLVIVDWRPTKLNPLSSRGTTTTIYAPLTFEVKFTNTGQESGHGLSNFVYLFVYYIKFHILSSK